LATHFGKDFFHGIVAKNVVNC